MSAHLLRHLSNLLLPGCQLVMAGRLLGGLALLLPALGCLALLLLGAVLSGGELWAAILLWALIVYGLLSLLAGLLLWRLQHWPRIDPGQAQACYERGAVAWLADRHEEAAGAADELCRLAPQLPGAWRFLALCADGAGRHKQAERARRRAARLLEQAGDGRGPLDADP